MAQREHRVRPLRREREPHTVTVLIAVKIMRRNQGVRNRRLILVRALMRHMLPSNTYLKYLSKRILFVEMNKGSIKIYLSGGKRWLMGTSNPLLILYKVIKDRLTW